MVLVVGPKESTHNEFMDWGNDITCILVRAREAIYVTLQLIHLKVPDKLQRWEKVWGVHVATAVLCPASQLAA